MGRISDAALLGMNYPESPGYKEPTTSRDAAVAAALTSTILRERMFAAIMAAGSRGATADEASAAIGVTPLAGRPRVTELRTLGRIKPSVANRRRPSSTGRSSIVWVVA